MGLKYLRKFSIYVFLNGYINTIQSIIIKASKKLIVISWSFDLVPTSQWILKLSKMAILIKASIKSQTRKDGCGVLDTLRNFV